MVAISTDTATLKTCIDRLRGWVECLAARCLGDGEVVRQGGAPDTGRALRRGYALAAVFFLGFGTWAATAPLSSAVMAPGRVVVVGNRKIIQHLEGGIVAAIAVRDGDRVAAGDLLVRLDDTQPRARMEMLQGRLIEAKAEQARLQAERQGATAIAFDGLLEQRAEVKVAAALLGQTGIFQARRDNYITQVAVLEQDIAQKQEEMRGMERLVAAERQQIAFIREELDVVAQLVERGLERKPRLLSLQRQSADLEGNLSLHVAQIARAKQGIGESRLRIREIRTNVANEVIEALKAVDNTIFELHQQIATETDVLRRTEIRAPVDGAVIDLQIHTTGGVVAPGQKVMELVPLAQALVVEAYIDPSAIDEIEIGLPARVRFTALAFRDAVPLDGTLIGLSADSLIEEATRRPYFKGMVELKPEAVSTLPATRVVPGMQAEVLVVTGDRTLLDYLVEPLRGALFRGVRER